MTKVYPRGGDAVVEDEMAVLTRLYEKLSDCATRLAGLDPEKAETLRAYALQVRLWINERSG
jgi:hypothetical protein